MKKVLTGLTLLTPALLLAQGDADLGNLEDFALQLRGLIDLLIPIVFGLALLFFLWGLAKYIFAAGDEEAKEEGKRIMVWGIIALFIMASVWGIVAFLQNLFGVDGSNAPELPRVPSYEGTSNRSIIDIILGR